MEVQLKTKQNVVLHKNETKQCSEEEAENAEFLSSPPACSFGSHSGFDENQSMDVTGEVGIHRDKCYSFFSFLEIGAIIKIRKDYLNSEVAVSLSRVL